MILVGNRKVVWERGRCEASSLSRLCVPLPLAYRDCIACWRSNAMKKYARITPAIMSVM